MLEQDAAAARPARGPSGVVVPLVGEVRATGVEHPPFIVVDAAGLAIEPASEFLRDLAVCGNAAASVRSYAFDLLRWFRFLAAVEVDWATAQRDDVRDFVAWLREAANPQRSRGRADAPEPGAVNVRTGKRYLAAGYAPATINHALSVLSAFYGFHAERAVGSVVDPVPGPAGGRWSPYHNPMTPFTAHRRAGYRQKQEVRAPRAIPDDLYAEVFAALGCHRDRALLAFYVSSCARPSELLGLTGIDVDYGDQRIAVVSKGTRAREWVPASPEAFTWLALYLADGYAAGLTEPVWWTRRTPRRPLTYTAMRAVLSRVNAGLGTNWTLHDLRHTGALRLARDPALTITDVQAVLRHRWLSSTEVYTRSRIDEVIARVQAHYTRAPVVPVEGAATWRYAAEDWTELFGEPT